MAREYELRHSEITIVIDKEQNIVFASEDCLDILGYLPEELEGQKINILMNPRQARVHQAHVDNYIKNGRYRADIGRFPATKKDGDQVDVYVWINSKKPMKIGDENYVVGVLWDSNIIDKYNEMDNRHNFIMKRIDELASAWVNAKEDTNKELVNIKAMLGIKLNPLMSEEQKQMSINIINEGGKASQDTNIDEIKGDGNITQHGS